MSAAMATIPARTLAPAKLGSSRSEIAGACDGLRGLSVSPIAPRPRVTVVVPEAKRVCDLTGKKRNNGYSVSFSNHRTKKVQQPNLQVKRIWWEAGQRYVQLKLSTKAIKTLEWKGLDKMAKEAGLDLTKY